MKGYIIVGIILVGILAVYGWNNARKNDQVMATKTYIKNRIKKLSSDRRKLLIKGLKLYPKSKKQMDIRKDIYKIDKKIKDYMSKL